VRRFRHPALTVRLRWQRAVLPILLAVLALGAGVGAGALSTGLLDGAQRQSLDAYLGTFFRALAGGGVGPSPGLIFRASLRSESLLAALAWTGGLFSLGLPLTLGSLFVRGFAVGFTVGFLASQEGAGGLLLSAVAILPGSLVTLPVQLTLGAVAISQSLRLLSARLRRSPPPGGRDLAVYGGVAVACGLALLAGCLVDGYVVPPLLRAVGPALGI
jgi:stage II sporulation protein M